MSISAAVHWLDQVYSSVRIRPLCFEDGWGAVDLMESLMPELLGDATPPPIRLRWEREVVRGGLRVRDGSFESPEIRIAPESRRARVRWLLPAKGPVAGGCVMLASWGDEAFLMRRVLLGPLVRRGLGALLLENPYFGHRRPTCQKGVGVRRVSDLALMGLATVQEARGLLRWLRDEGVEHAGIAGYSMGGALAAMGGASVPWPIAIVPMAPAASPAAAFTQGPISRDVAWSALGGADQSRERLRSMLLPLSVLSLPVPRDPTRAIVVGTLEDGVIPPEEMAAIAAHWRGAELRWLPAGHVSAVVFHARALRSAILDAFARGGLDLRQRPGR